MKAKRMKTDRNDDEQPMFDSLDEFCEAYGFDDATKEQMRRAMELTAPSEAERFAYSLATRFNDAMRH